MKRKILVLLFFVSIGLQAQIDRTEPPFWWSGIEQEDLQILLFYGKNIAQYKVLAENDVIISNLNYLPMDHLAEGILFPENRSHI